MWTFTPNALNEVCDSIGYWEQYLGTVTVDPAGQFYFPQNGVLSKYSTSTPPLPFDVSAIPYTIFSVKTELLFHNLSTVDDGQAYYNLRVYTTVGVKIQLSFYNDAIYCDVGSTTLYASVPMDVSAIWQFDVVINTATSTAAINCYRENVFIGRISGAYYTTTLKGYLFGVYAGDETAYARMKYLEVGRIDGCVLPLISLDGAIDFEPYVSGTVNLPLLAIDNQMLDNKILEMPILNFDSSAIVGKMVSSSPSLPLLDTSFDLRVYDLQTSLSMPLLSIDGNVTYYNRYADITITLPAITGMAYGGGTASITLPAIVSVSSGTVSRVGTVTIVLPSMIASVTGLVSEVGNVSIILPPITAKVLGHSNILATVAAILPVLDIVSTGLTGEVASAGITLPSIKSVSTAWWNSGATVSVIIPAIRIGANAVILTTDYEVLVINTKNMALTNYISYAYNSLCEFNGKHFGAKSSGIYELSGTTDNGSSISWKIKTGKLDMQENEKHSPKKKYVLLSYHPSGDLTLTVIGKEEEYEYDVESYEETDGVSRIKLGKGIRDKYLQFELKNKNGESVFLDKMKIFSDKAMTR